MAKNNQYTEDQLKQAIEVRKPYQQPCVNYNGSCNGIPYIEILSKYILDKPRFDLKPYKAREKFVLHHKPDTYEPDIESEKGLCRYWYLKGFDNENLTQRFGKPIDYELNIHGKRVNVDLVTYKSITNEVFFIEVKGRVPKGKNHYESTETLLRCALEIKTYFDSLKEEDLKTLRNQLNAEKSASLPVETTFRMGVIVPEGSKAAKQYRNPKAFPQTASLVSKWKIEVETYKNGSRFPKE